MKKNHQSKGLIIALGILHLASCAPGQVSPTPDTAAIFTQSAQTVEVQLTLTAAVQNTTSTPTMSSITNTPQQALTPLSTSTPTVTNTPFIMVTTQPTSQATCDQYQFIDDITIPDGATIQPGAVFEKIWRILNTGTCTWTTAYELIYAYGGEGTNWDQMQPVNFSKEVNPGGLLDISVTLTAPTVSGSYGAYYRPINDKGLAFGPFMWIFIRVP